MKIGYIKLHRKIQDNFLWLEERRFSRAEAWIDLLMEANHYGRTVLITGHNYQCKRGQTCKSILTWSQRWRWSRHKVKDFLNLLEKEEQIEFESDTRTTMITVLNYNIYQDPEDKVIKNEIEMLQQKDNRRTTEGQQKDINNNDKNVNNGNNEEYIVKNENENIFIQWNDFANKNNLPIVTKRTDKRLSGIKRRLKESEFNLDKIFEEIEKSRFLKGSNGWKVHFDFVFCSANNYIKILEGNYRGIKQSINRGKGAINLDVLQQELGQVRKI